MPPLPPCFRPRSAAAAAGPNISTSIYETHLGFASFTWSKTLLGLSLHASVHLTALSSTDSSFQFKIRPFFLLKRKGTRRFHSHIAHQIRTISIAWNLTRARFPSIASPEPSSGFFIAVSVDGELFLVAGDLCAEAQRKMKAKQRSPTMLVSRSEDVLLGGKDRRRMGSYRSAVRIGGADREIGIEIDGGMSVTVDRKRILSVRRVRWNFRGSERVEMEDGGGAMLISWDLQPWFFPCKENASAASAAIFVFCFERAEGEREIWCESVMRMRNLERDWSESSSCGGGLEKMRGRKKRLLKTCSSSSSFSSAGSSSAASSSVAEWWSSEEAAMRGVDGFTLVVYAWKG